VKRLGVSEQNSVVERSSLPARKGNGGEDHRPTIFARDRQSAIDLLKLLRSAQQSRYCRSDAFAQMGTARFIIAARKRADPNRDDSDKTNVEASDHA